MIGIGGGKFRARVFAEARATGAASAILPQLRLREAATP
jgi:hypothetical protein